MKTTKTFPKNVAYNTLSKLEKSNESIIFMHQVAEQAKKRAGKMLVTFKFE